MSDEILNTRNKEENTDSVHTIRSLYIGLLNFKGLIPNFLRTSKMLLTRPVSFLKDYLGGNTQNLSNPLQFYIILLIIKILLINLNIISKYDYNFYVLIQTFESNGIGIPILRYIFLWLISIKLRGTGIKILKVFLFLNIYEIILNYIIIIASIINISEENIIIYLLTLSTYLIFIIVFSKVIWVDEKKIIIFLKILLFFVFINLGEIITSFIFYTK